VKAANLIVEHNLPVAVADHLGSFFKDVFPDSEIAKSYACGSTKTACIINGSLAPYFKSILVVALKKQPFAIAIDGSNDNGLEKMNPLTVRLYDGHNKVTTQLLDMCLTTGMLLNHVALYIKYAGVIMFSLHRYKCRNSCSNF